MNVQNSKSRPTSILLIEDNPGDRRLIIEVMKAGRLTTKLNTVEDGVKAMDFLRKQGDYADAPTPDLILIDLNLPKMSGQEVLTKIKTDSKLKRIPVVVLTSSESDGDIGQCYDLHANCYIAKPADIEKFNTVVRSIENFWFSIVTLAQEE